MRVLVVEDEPSLAASILEWLRLDGHAVDAAFDGREALDRALVTDYDVVVLDRDLPLVHGDDICRALLEHERPSRILMLTAAAAVADRIAGLRIGADDYLAKPFAMAELSARVHALGRRARPAASPQLVCGGFVVDVHRHHAEWHGQTLALSRKEFGVLEELVRADGGVVSAEWLLERVWDQNADPFTSAVRLTVHKLRTKLPDPEAVETLPGVGYRLRM